MMQMTTQSAPLCGGRWALLPGRLEPDTNPLGLCSAGPHAHKGRVTVPGVCADGGSLKRGLTSLRVPSSSPPPSSSSSFSSLSFFRCVFTPPPSSSPFFVLVGLTRVTRRDAHVTDVTATRVTLNRSPLLSEADSDSPFRDWQPAITQAG